MMRTTKKNTSRDVESYNVTIWRVDARGAVVSVQAGRFVDGLIVRAAGHWSHDNGTPAYHAPFVRAMTTFAGEPVSLVITRGADAMLDAMRRSFAVAFAAARVDTLATFEAVS